jgi:hypothetical protein
MAPHLLHFVAVPNPCRAARSSAKRAKSRLAVFRRRNNQATPDLALGAANRPLPFLGRIVSLMSSSGGPIVLAYRIAEGPVTVRLGVFDVSGREIWSSLPALRGPGEYGVRWQPLARGGGQLARSVYVTRLEAGKATDSRKFVMRRL